jgi:hypothetical protein
MFRIEFGDCRIWCPSRHFKSTVQPDIYIAIELHSFLGRRIATTPRTPARATLNRILAVFIWYNQTMTKQMMDGFPRRNRIDLLTPAEKAVYDVIGVVESVGAHPLLTDAVILLGQARDKLSDYVELK